MNHLVGEDGSFGWSCWDSVTTFRHSEKPETLLGKVSGGRCKDNSIRNVVPMLLLVTKSLNSQTQDPKSQLPSERSQGKLAGVQNTDISGCKQCQTRWSTQAQNPSDSSQMNAPSVKFPHERVNAEFSRQKSQTKDPKRRLANATLKTKSRKLIFPNENCRNTLSDRMLLS